jgi:Jacalin-like lectin domain
MQAATDSLVTDATSLASLLVGAIAGITPAQVALALKDPRNYPSLTALQMGQTLKANGVFPQITADQTRSALQAAGYAQADIDSATTQLFPPPPPPPPPPYRKLGPAGAGSGNAFDDSDAAKNLGQPITKVIVDHGNVVDAIKVFYGNQQTPSFTHGGSGGAFTDTITLDPGDMLTGISGFSGSYFGGNYILQLTFRTRNGKTFGPYGDMQFASGSTAFSLTTRVNEHIIAFFGSVASGNNGQAQYLGSIGITIQVS